jgi:tripartite-type tricarboxylate transporter receptor subunit TctC
MWIWMKPRRAFVVPVVCGVFFAALGASASAQTFPTRPISLVVPFAAGGPSDMVAQQVARRMAARLGQAVNIDYVAGAGGTTGIGKVAKSPADGYTLAFGSIGTHVAAVAVYQKLAYDPIGSFDPIGFLGTAPMVLVAKTALPAKNLKEFEAYLKANKSTAAYASAGTGSVSHWACVMFLSALKQDVKHVPFKGGGPALADVVAGNSDFMCDQSITAIPQIQAAKVKAIAVLSRAKVNALPGLATAAASGLDGVDVRAWNALFAPKGTPPDVVKRLNDELRAVMTEPDFRAEMAKLGVELPAPETLLPSLVTAVIQLGIKRDVPALQARAEYLD